MKSAATRKKCISIVAAALLLAGTLTGCGDAGSSIPREDQTPDTGLTQIADSLLGEVTQAAETGGNLTYSLQGKLAMEDMAILDYSVPVQNAGIAVNRLGYDLIGDLQAVVVSEVIPESYRVINLSSGRVVKTGRIEENGLIDFSGLTEAGEYRISCDTIGQSYTFTVMEDFYTNRLEKYLDDFTEKCAENTVTTGELLALLTVYEWEPSVLPNRDGDKIPDALKAVRDYVAEFDYASIEEQEVADYIAFLAKFSYLYQNFDVSLATDCLQKASSLYSQYTSVSQQNADSFRALAELYRASGRNTYRNTISEYITYFGNTSGYLNETGYLYGAMTYMLTRQNVDKDLCDILIADLLEVGEGIGNRYESMLNPRTGINSGENELFCCAQQVMCSNYVVEGYQYNAIMIKFLHYLGGRNLSSCIYSNESRLAEDLMLYAWMASVEQQGLLE